MALEQESKFVLNLELGESYIYGTAFTYDNSYSINIQQASNNLIVLPSDFTNIKESREALVSFGLSGHSDTNKIFVRSEVKVGRGDLIEVYMNNKLLIVSLFALAAIASTYYMLYARPKVFHANWLTLSALWYISIAFSLIFGLTDQDLERLLQV